MAKRSPATTSTLEAGQRLLSHRGQTSAAESRKVPTYRPWMFEIVLIAIIADPTALVYSFQARRPPTRMPRGLSHCCNNFNAATAASFNREHELPRPWRTPRVLRKTPVYSFRQIPQLCAGVIVIIHSRKAQTASRTVASCHRTLRPPRRPRNTNRWPFLRLSVSGTRSPGRRAFAHLRVAGR